MTHENMIIFQRSCTFARSISALKRMAHGGKSKRAEGQRKQQVNISADLIPLAMSRNGKCA